MSTNTHTPNEAVPAKNGALAPAPVPSVTPRTDADLIREIIELEDQCPPPDTEAIRADARWFQEHWGKPELTQYRGSFVAVFNGAVVGHGDNSHQLRLDTAKKFNVHPCRLIVELIPLP